MEDLKRLFLAMLLFQILSDIISPQSHPLLCQVTLRQTWEQGSIKSCLQFQLDLFELEETVHLAFCNLQRNMRIVNSHCRFFRMRENHLHLIELMSPLHHLIICFYQTWMHLIPIHSIMSYLAENNPSLTLHFLSWPPLCTSQLHSAQYVVTLPQSHFLHTVLYSQ